MTRTLGPAAAGTLVCVVMLASPGEPTRAEARPKPTRNVSPEDLWWKTSSPSVGGGFHNGLRRVCGSRGDGQPRPHQQDHRVPRRLHPRDPSLVWRRRPGNVNGFTQDIPVTEWQVPDGERITRVEGEVVGRYVTRLSSPPKETGSPCSARSAGSRSW